MLTSQNRRTKTAIGVLHTVTYDRIDDEDEEFRRAGGLFRFEHDRHYDKKNEEACYDKTTN